MGLIPRLRFGSLRNDNYVIGCLSQGIIGYQDLTKTTKMKRLLDSFNKKFER